ncbi:unnamed protein product, partial [marine sediment metagenome]
MKNPLKSVHKVYKVITKNCFLWLKIRFLTIKELKKPPMYNGYKIPPPKFRQLTTASHITVEEHIREGFQASATLIDILKKEGINPRQVIGNVLDFGCGGGRVLRQIHKEMPNARLFGSDVDEFIIDWNRRNLNFANWSVNNYLPPTNFESNFFDMIYLISVFTYMDEKTQFVWLNEFSRIIKPKGFLMITIVPLEPRNNSKGFMYKYRKREFIEPYKL